MVDFQKIRNWQRIIYKRHYLSRQVSQFHCVTDPVCIDGAIVVLLKAGQFWSFVLCYENLSWYTWAWFAGVAIGDADYWSNCDNIHCKSISNELLYNCTCQSLGCCAQAPTLSKIHNLGGCWRTAHQKLGGDGTELRTCAAPSAWMHRNQQLLWHWRAKQEPQTTTCSNPSSESSNPIKSFPPSHAKLSKFIPAFKQYPAQCLMQTSLPQGSFAHASDVPLITAFHTDRGTNDRVWRRTVAVTLNCRVRWSTRHHALRDVVSLGETLQGSKQDSKDAFKNQT